MSVKIARNKFIDLINKEIKSASIKFRDANSFIEDLHSYLVKELKEDNDKVYNYLSLSLEKGEVDKPLGVANLVADVIHGSPNLEQGVRNTLRLTLTFTGINYFNTPSLEIYPYEDGEIKFHYVSGISSKSGLFLDLEEIGSIFLDDSTQPDECDEIIQAFFNKSLEEILPVLKGNNKLNQRLNSSIENLTRSVIRDFRNPSPNDNLDKEQED